MTKEKYTTYNIAVHWLDGGLVLCNEITEIDNSIFDNMRFDFYNEETGAEIEIFQWFLTNWSESDVEWLENTFPDLLFTYSNKLGCFVLCVNHYGTMWDSVECRVADDSDWETFNKDLIITEENKNPKFKKIREY